MSDAPDLCPCPLCGEAELISFREAFDDECVVAEVAGETLYLEPLAIGTPGRNRRFEVIDHVCCLLCGTDMPLRTWQGWRPTPAARELYRAYYYDDEPQAWEQVAAA